MADQSTDVPFSGSILYVPGQASVVRIPVPGTGGLAIEFKPRGWVPQTGSTSTLFIQDASGKRHLRLDYGYNTKTKTIDYHWNQSGTHPQFGISDHSRVGRGGQGLYHAAKYFRWAGRVLVVTGLAVDVVSVVVASNPLRRASEVATGWAGAFLGCRLGGAAGAAGGTAVAPGVGTAIGGVVGCIVGGGGGYFLGSKAGGTVYEWAEGTLFTPVPEFRSNGP